MLIFALLWNAFIAVIYVGMARSPNTPWQAYFVPGLHAAVGFGLAAYALALFINRTEIRIDDRAIRVGHGPIRFRRDREILLSEIDEIIQRVRTSRSTVHCLTLQTLNGRWHELAASFCRDEISALAKPLQQELLRRRPARLKSLAAADTMPRQVQVMHDAFGLTVRRMWWRKSSISGVGVTLLWNAIVGGCLLAAIRGGGPLFAFIIIGVLGAVGLFLAYTIVAHVLNRTTVRIEEGIMRIRHWPIWWPGNGHLCQRHYPFGRSA